MTRAEAIERLKFYKKELDNYIIHILDKETLDLAIKALEEDEKNAKYGSELARIVAEHEEVSDGH